MARRKKRIGLNQENSNKFFDDDKKKKKKKKLKKTEKGDIVDKSTGLTETAPVDQGEETEDAKKLREYQEKQNTDNLEVTINKKPTGTQRAKVTIGGKRDGEIYDEMEKEGKEDEYFKEGGISDRVRRAKNIAEDPSMGQDYKNVDEAEARIKEREEQERLRKEVEEREQEKGDPNREAKEVLGEDATEEEIADYNSDKEKSKKDLSALEAVLQEEVSNKAQNQEELQQGYELANKIAKETKRKEEEEEEKDKKDRKRASSLMSIITKKFPNINIEAISNMKPKDIFKLAAKAGLDGMSSSRQKRLADNYIDTVQTLGVQDYFPDIADKIAVGTFQGSRIGSQTIYSGAGGLAPMGLYDAKRRALKERFKMSQKSIENSLKFDQVPPPYNDVYQGAMARAYKDIMSNTDLDETERQLRLGQLEGFAREITYAYNTAKNINERSLETRNDQKDKIFIPREIKREMDKFQYAYFDQEYMDKAARGEINLAQEVSKLRFYDNLITSTKDLAKDFSQFKKTRVDEDFYASLSEEEKENLDLYQRDEELSNKATDVLINRYVEYYADDLDQAFEDAFYEGDKLQDQYDPGQEEQAKRLFKEMLAPSIKEDLKSISTGLGARLAHSRGTKRQEYENMYENKIGPPANEEFANIAKESSSKSDYVNNLGSVGGTVRSGAKSFNLGNAVAVEKQAPSHDFYMPGTRFQRSIGGGASGYKIRATIDGVAGLYTADDLIGKIAGGKTVTSTDGGAPITKDDLTTFKTSAAGGDRSRTVGPAQFALKMHSEAPAYRDGATVKGITDDASLTAYKASSNKIMMWQDIGRPVYEYTSGGVKDQREFPFMVQGAPYIATKAKMQELDTFFKKTGLPTRKDDDE